MTSAAQPNDVEVIGVVRPHVSVNLEECSVGVVSRTPGVIVPEVACSVDSAGNWSWLLKAGATYDFTAWCSGGNSEMFSGSAAGVTISAEQQNVVIIELR
jgi:hypothetical protein